MKSCQTGLQWPRHHFQCKQFITPSSTIHSFCFLWVLFNSKCVLEQPTIRQSFISQRRKSSKIHCSYLQKSMSTSSSSRFACPITGRKKSSVMRLGVMLCNTEAVRRIWAKRSPSPGWRSWTTLLKACWASCCKPSTNRAAFKSGTSVGGKTKL